MMKKILLWALLITAVSATNIFAQDDDQPEWKSVNIISAIVKYETKFKDTVRATSTEYYEEWGQYTASEASQQIRKRNGEKVTLNQITITTPDSAYIYFPDYALGTKDTTGSKAKIIEKFELEEGDYDKVEEKQMIEAGFAKEGTEEINGRLCQIWTITKNGATQKIWMWKGIEIKIIIDTPNGVQVTEAVDIQEEPTIPFKKFIPMTGVKWKSPQELNMELGKYFQ